MPKVPLFCMRLTGRLPDTKHKTMVKLYWSAAPRNAQNGWQMALGDLNHFYHCVKMSKYSVLWPCSTDTVIY